LDFLGFSRPNLDFSKGCWRYAPARKDFTLLLGARQSNSIKPSVSRQIFHILMTRIVLVILIFINKMPSTQNAIDTIDSS
jgi:hypothetical protein